MTLSAPAVLHPLAARVLAASALIACGLALAALPLNLTAAAGAAALALPVGLIRPGWILALIPFAVPFGTLVGLGGAGSPVGGLELALVGVLGLLLIHTLAGHDRRAHWPLALLPVALWTALLALSTTMAVAQNDAIKETVKWAEAALAIWLAANLAVTPRTRFLLLAAICVAAGAESLVGVYQFFTRTGPEGFLIGDRFLRAHGTFGQPNPFAGYLALVIPMVLAFALGRPGAPRLPLLSLATLAVAAGVISAGVAMSLSRGAWIALAAGLAMVLAVQGRAGRLALAGGMLLGLAVALVGAFGLLPAAITSRLEIITQYMQLFDARSVEVTPENFAIVERMAIWQAAWAMFNDAPLWGIGAGNFDARYLDYSLRGWNDLPGHAHNYYLTLLAETGVAGLATFLLMAVVLVATAWRVARRALRAGAAPDGYAWAVGTLGMLTVVAVHNLLDSLFVHGIPAHLGVVLGAALAADASAPDTSPPDKD